MAKSQNIGAAALTARESELLRVEIGRDMSALADYIGEHGDPAAELQELFDDWAASV
jgi:hypothetical protein